MSPRAAEHRLVGAKTAKEKVRASQVDAVRMRDFAVDFIVLPESAYALWKGENASQAWSKDDVALSRMGVGHSN